MNVASVTAPRWAVSTRTRGEVLVAGVSTPALELVLLGVPAQVSPGDAEAWLTDLAGVAADAARADVRERPIPAVLFHALSGLLFSQAELWSSEQIAPPCAVAFVESAQGAAFGWIGEAFVQVALDGRPVEPAWVTVRDEDGREAHGVLLAGGANVQVLVEYTRGGVHVEEAPAAIEAEWTLEGREPLPAPAPAASAPSPVVVAPEPPAEAAAAVAPAHIPEAPPAPPVDIAQSAPMHEIIADAERLAAEIAHAPAPVEQARETHETHVASEDAAVLAEAPVEAPMSPVAMGEEAAAAEAVGDATEPGEADSLTTEQSEALESLTTPRESHPVARWLGRMMGFARRAPAAERRHESAPDDERTPLSSYDSLLSQHVPETPALEQTALQLDAVANEIAVPDAQLEHGEPLAIEPASAATEREAPLPDFVPAPPVRIADAPVISPAAELTPPPPALESARERLERAMQAADAGELPVLHVPLPAVPTDLPLAIDREPVAPDASFGIPALASRPEVPAVPEPAEPESGPWPPVLRVEIPAHEGASPPVLHVEPTHAPPPAIVPTAPVAALAADVSAFAPSASAARRAWPVPAEPERKPLRISRRTWTLIGVVVGVFGAGWIVGVVANPSGDGPGPLTRALRAIGLGGARFTASVNSTPNGAWIAVDGKDVAKRTPADIELTPGAHMLTLSLPELGGAEVPVRGKRGDHVPLAPSLNGALEINSSDAGVPISVSLDGRPLGYAPLHVDAVAPGLHEVQFSGPGMPAWAQTIQVGVRRTAEMVAHPMSAPANGVIQVQASLNDEQGATPLSGAQVFVDGELRGATPVTLDLPRGPHSLKLTWKGQTAPVQVIDLPGGNQRFASFAFGLDNSAPQVVLLGGVHPADAQETAVVSAGLPGLQLGDVREAWLHVRMPEGLWRSYPMTAMRGARGPVVVCVFPPNAFDAQGQSRWYVSASTLQGDEYFSEMQGASTGGAGGQTRHHRAPANAPKAAGGR